MSQQFHSLVFVPRKGNHCLEKISPPEFVAIICDGPGMETASVPLDGWRRKKMWCIHVDEGIVFSRQKGNLTVCDDTDGA